MVEQRFLLLACRKPQMMLWDENMSKISLPPSEVDDSYSSGEKPYLGDLYFKL
jgi:hypothetical protein